MIFIQNRKILPALEWAVENAQFRIDGEKSRKGSLTLATRVNPLAVMVAGMIDCRPINADETTETVRKPTDKNMETTLIRHMLENINNF
jgi:hypothetical protein